MFTAAQITFLVNQEAKFALHPRLSGAPPFEEFPLMSLMADWLRWRKGPQDHNNLRLIDPW